LEYTNTNKTSVYKFHNLNITSIYNIIIHHNNPNPIVKVRVSSITACQMIRNIVTAGLESSNRLVCTPDIWIGPARTWRFLCVRSSLYTKPKNPANFKKTRGYSNPAYRQRNVRLIGLLATVSATRRYWLENVYGYGSNKDSNRSNQRE